MKINGIAISGREETLLRKIFKEAEEKELRTIMIGNKCIKCIEAQQNAKSLVILKIILDLNK